MGYVDAENSNESLKCYEDTHITKQIPSQLASLVTYGVESTKWTLSKRKYGQLGAEQMCGREWLERDRDRIVVYRGDPNRNNVTNST